MLFTAAPSPRQTVTHWGGGGVPHSRSFHFKFFLIQIGTLPTAETGTPPSDVRHNGGNIASLSSQPATPLSSTADGSSTLTQEATPPPPSGSGSSVEHPATYKLDSSEWSARCRRTYLVLGRLFKLHPHFDAAIEGILAGDPRGCVLLIHETADEEWTRGVWRRLMAQLGPQG